VQLAIGEPRVIANQNSGTMDLAIHLKGAIENENIDGLADEKKVSRSKRKRNKKSRIQNTVPGVNYTLDDWGYIRGKISTSAISQYKSTRKYQKPSGHHYKICQKLIESADLDYHQRNIHGKSSLLPKNNINNHKDVKNKHKESINRSVHKSISKNQEQRYPKLGDNLSTKTWMVVRG